MVDVFVFIVPPAGGDELQVSFSLYFIKFFLKKISNLEFKKKKKIRV